MSGRAPGNAPEILRRVPVATAEDVFALRQLARAASAAIGCDDADQVRLATALSELGREALVRGVEIGVVFTLAADGALVVDVQHFPRGAAGPSGAGGLDAARRLLPSVTLSDEPAGGVSVRLQQSPSRIGAPTPRGAAIRATLTKMAVLRPLDELRLENRDLVGTLDALKARQDELVRLNAELEETNRGVMAMYSQLAGELDETNRGVVALYAELDERTLQLNAASESKSRFLANISHELRSPVNSVLGLANLLLDPAGDSLSAEQQQQLRFLVTSASELLRLVNELLDLAKAESGRLEPVAERFDPVGLFTELRGALRPLLKPDVALQVDERALPPIETDRILLGQVLRNLLVNALKYTTSGSVRLSAVETPARTLEIAVSDTGIGIPPDDQPKVFEEFFQVRGPLQAQQKGTGLGLPYARRVAQCLGGDIRLESEPGRGSTFTVTLPLEWQPLLRAPASPGVVEARTATLDRVVIIDDDPAFRTALRGMLQEDARSVAEASRGDEGLGLMRTARPNVVFLDLRMPDRDGSEVFAEMRSDPALREIPVVIVTSTELAAVPRAQLSGARVLSKSTINRASVRATLAEIFGG